MLSNAGALHDPHPEDRARRPPQRGQVHAFQPDRAAAARPSPTTGPGSTRDRNYAQTSWQGAAFELIDTGGLLLGTDDPLLGPARDQAERAIEEADLVVLVVDGRAGLLPDDCAIAARLRQRRQARAGGGQQGRGQATTACDEFARARVRPHGRRSPPSTARAWATCSTRRWRACRGSRSPEEEDAAAAARARGPAERGEVVAAQPAAGRGARAWSRPSPAPRATRWTACS